MERKSQLQNHSQQKQTLNAQQVDERQAVRFSFSREEMTEAQKANATQLQHSANINYHSPRGSGRLFDYPELSLSSNHDGQRVGKPNFSFQSSLTNTKDEDYSLLRRGGHDYRNGSTYSKVNEEKMHNYRLMAGQIKKIKFFWRGTNIYYPYTFLRRYRRKPRNEQDEYFTEVIDFSKKVIQNNAVPDDKCQN